jgi:glycosyltransferase involved in cell wall biosynthesis
MRILIVTQYFWPEEFRINDIVKYFSAKGHQVDVVTGEPNYPNMQMYEKYKTNKKKYNYYAGANIIRVPIVLRGRGTPFKLFLNYLSFILSAILFGSYKIRKKKYDIIFTFATSPITVAIPAIFFSLLKNCKHVLWVLDIWPDILRELKIINNKFILYLLKKIVNFIYSKSDIILAQSKGFENLISENLEDKSKVYYFPAWSENLSRGDEEDFLLDLKKYKNKFNIVFTGNIGEAQNFENIIRAAEIVKNEKDLQWLIIGTGRKLKEYTELVKKKNIKNFLFLGHKPFSQIKSFHDLATILLVSLSDGKFLSTTIPGKLQTYLNNNKFILAFAKGSSAQLIKESKTGISVNPASPIELAKTIINLKNNPKIIKKVKNNNYGTEYLKKNFNKELLLLELEKYFYNNIIQIKIIKNLKNIPFDKNFSLSGLNLAFLGYWVKNKIKINSNIYLWPDGVFYKRFFKSTIIKKIPGRKIITDLKIPNKIKKIYVFGNLNFISKKYLQNMYKKKIIHIPLPVDDVNNLYNKYFDFKFLDSDLIFLTLPTPKQEQLANLIIKNNNFFKIICVGGAINMASGVEKPVPAIIERLNFEFLWRLRTDTFRRLRRLVVSSSFYILGEFFFKFRDINTKILNDR